MQEKFRERDDKERDAGIADPAGVFAHADEEERERVERPGDRVSHVAREISGEGKGERRADGEVVGDLDVEEKEGEERA